MLRIDRVTDSIRRDQALDRLPQRHLGAVQMRLDVRTLHVSRVVHEWDHRKELRYQPAIERVRLLISSNIVRSVPLAPAELAHVVKGKHRIPAWPKAGVENESALPV